MRLGDLDALKAELISFYDDSYRLCNEIACMVDSAPTINAVPVVRCKDCEFSHMDGWFCGGAGMMPEHTTLPESFCDHGERKDGEG